MFFCTEDISRLTVKLLPTYLSISAQRRRWMIYYILLTVSGLDFASLMDQKWNAGVVRLYKPQTVILAASADA